MKIYLCVDEPNFHGEYNEETQAVFTLKRNAKRFCKATGFALREIDMDQFEKAMSLNYKLFDVELDKESVISVKKSENYYLSVSDIDLCKFNHNNSAFKLKCFARDEQHAIKIAEAKRTQIFEENSWPDKPVNSGRRFVGDIPAMDTAIFDPYKELYKKFSGPQQHVITFSQLMEDSSIHGSSPIKKSLDTDN